jgi:RNA polymerase sigma factor (sigma-70 family)
MEDRTEYIQADKLYHEHEHLAEETVYKVFPKPKLTAHRKGLDLEDLIQYAKTGLWIACTSYDDTKGTKFVTHAINHMRWHLMDRVKRECNPMKLSAREKYVFSEMYKIDSLDKDIATYEGPTTLHDLLASDTDVEGSAVDGVVLADMLGVAVTEQERRILELRLQDVQYSEIGKMYGCTRGNIQAKVKKLRERILAYREREKSEVSYG